MTARSHHHNLLTMSDIFDETSLTYSYNPTSLLASWERLAEQESELLSRTSSTAHILAQRSSSAIMTTDGTTQIVVAATQVTGAGLPPSDVSGYCFRAEQAIELAVRRDANLVVLPELWSTPYFCQSRDASLMGLACELEKSLLIQRMYQLAKLYSVVLVVSFYEQRNQTLYSSVCVIDSDGTLAGVYRKSHVPDGPKCNEKFYFAPGDSGFKVYLTRFGKIGVALGHDLWYPECARALSLQGADLLVYPVSMAFDSQSLQDHWLCTLKGHAAANVIPVVCSNRFGTEILCSQEGTEEARTEFCGRSFIVDATGTIVEECEAYQHEIAATIHKILAPAMVATAVIDVDENRKKRLSMGLFRDRRPELYKILLTKDGAV